MAEGVESPIPVTVPIGQAADLATFRQAREAGKTEVPNPAAVPAEPVVLDPDVEGDPELATAIDTLEAPAAAETPQQKAARTKRHKQAAIKQRVTKLAQARDLEKARADDLQRQLDDTRRAPAAVTRAAPGPGVTRPKPTRADFPLEKFPDSADPYSDQTDAFTEALADWKLEQQTAASRAAVERADADRQASERVTAHTTRVQAFKATAGAPADFDAKVQAQQFTMTEQNQRTTYEVVDAIHASARGPELEYYFASHPEAFAALQALPPRLAIYRLGQLDAQLTPVAAPAPAPVILPPAPHQPGGSGTTATTTFDPKSERGSVKDWRAHRETVAARRS